MPVARTSRSPRRYMNATVRVDRLTGGRAEQRPHRFRTPSVVVRDVERVEHQRGRSKCWRRPTLGRMNALSPALRDLFATGPLATVATVDPDGTPHITLAWAGLDGDELVMATFFNLDQRKLRN